MAEQNQGQEKTEQPTPKKLHDARKRGEVAKSQDLTASLILVAVIILAYAWIDHVLPEFRNNLIGYFRSSVQHGLPDSHLASPLISLTRDMALLISPIFIIVIIAALFANIVQVGFMVAPEAMKPKAQRINPVEGLKKIFSRKSLVELAKNILKVIITASVVYLVIRTMIPELLLIFFQEPLQILRTIFNMLLKAATGGAIAFFALSVFDVIYQRYEHYKNLKMTKQEVKEETKNTEGDPHLKQAQRQKQREIALNQIREEVPQATVVVTNPTHYAVALHYDENEMGAPEVSAMGAGYLAQRIREIAEEYEVPVLRRPEIARALYSQAEPGQQIPVELYEAVAEIIAAVYKLEQK